MQLSYTVHNSVIKPLYNHLINSETTLLATSYNRLTIVLQPSDDPSNNHHTPVM